MKKIVCFAAYFVVMSILHALVIALTAKVSFSGSAAVPSSGEAVGKLLFFILLITLVVEILLIIAGCKLGRHFFSNWGWKENLAVVGVTLLAVFGGYLLTTFGPLRL